MSSPVTCSWQLSQSGGNDTRNCICSVWLPSSWPTALFAMEPPCIFRLLLDTSYFSTTGLTLLLFSLSLGSNVHTSPPLQVHGENPSHQPLTLLILQLSQNKFINSPISAVFALSCTLLYQRSSKIQYTFKNYNPFVGTGTG